MYLPIIFFSIFTSLLFGASAVFFSLKEEKMKKLLHEEQIQEIHRIFENTILSEIQNKIGHSLDFEKLIDIITGSLDSLFTNYVVSSIIIEPEKLIFKTRLQENVSYAFIEQIKNSMLQSLTNLNDTPLPVNIDQAISGPLMDLYPQLPPRSFFHVPFFVNDNVAGLITISSTKVDNFHERDMMRVYRITDLAQTEFSRVKDILAVEKEKLMAIIGSLADGVFMVDLNNHLTVINNAAKGFLNIEKEHPTLTEVLSSLPNTYNFNGKIQGTINKNEAVEEKEIKIHDKVFQVFITPVMDTSIPTAKKVTGASVLLHDITLEKSVAQMKEDFTNIMVHELRSPLTAIKASTQLLTSSTPLTDEEKKKLLQLISEQSKKLLEEVALILDAAKLEAGLFTITKVSGDFKKLIQERASVFFSLAQEKLVKLVINVDPTIPDFGFDQIHMGQVLNNLISNSLKFTPSGGTITLTAKKDHENISVSVSDTGIGVAKDKRHLLFSKFSQIATPNAHVGTGLGLYMVKGVVEAHGGSIAVESEEGHGTTITFTLPLEIAPKQLSEAPVMMKNPQQMMN